MFIEDTMDYLTVQRGQVFYFHILVSMKIKSELFCLLRETIPLSNTPLTFLPLLQDIMGKENLSLHYSYIMVHFNDIILELHYSTLNCYYISYIVIHLTVITLEFHQTLVQIVSLRFSHYHFTSKKIFRILVHYIL